MGHLGVVGVVVAVAGPHPLSRAAVGAMKARSAGLVVAVAGPHPLSRAVAGAMGARSAGLVVAVAGPHPLSCAAVGAMDPNDPENAFGRLVKVGRTRETIAMRPCLGIWGKGLGAPKIAELTQGTKWSTSRSSVARMIKQAKHPFPGSVAVKISDLVEETWERPLPATLDRADDADH